MPGKQGVYTGFVSEDFVLPTHLSQYCITSIYYKFLFYKIIAVFRDFSETVSVYSQRGIDTCWENIYLVWIVIIFKMVALKVMYCFLLCFFPTFLAFLMDHYCINSEIFFCQNGGELMVKVVTGHTLENICLFHRFLGWVFVELNKFTIKDKKKRKKKKPVGQLKVMASQGEKWTS